MVFIKIFDDILNRVTIYRLVLYVLAVLVLYALGLSLLGKIPFRVSEILLSVFILLVSCVGSNIVLGRIFRAPINAESSYITALILSLIVLPPRSLQEIAILVFIGFCAMSSKFFVAVNKKHLFNPAAFAVIVSGVVFGYGANWWVANPYILIPVMVGGFVIVKKIQSWSMVLSFLITYFGINFAGLDGFLYSPLWFFSFVMLTEPQTSPTTKKLQILMGVVVGILATPSLNIVSLYATPELALLIGNVLTYLIGCRQKLILTLKDKIKLSGDTYQLVFHSPQKLDFKPGQYLEWTIWQNWPDTRGNRRYFTIASSPTEDDLRIGIKIYPKPSSFKQALLNLPKGGKIVASQLAGEFTLPEDENKKLVFIAGGIGITPFRSMVKYLLDIDQKRDIVLIFSNNSEKEIVYKEIFDLTQKQIGLKIVYVNTDEMGYIDEKLIRDHVPDFKNRLFYISGPHNLVEGLQQCVIDMGVKGSMIKTDFFPGYA